MKAVNKKTYLATTALEEFWDTSYPMFFIGDWCLRYSRKDVWEPLNATILESPWNDNDRISWAYSYVNDVFDRLIPMFSEKLNIIHNTNHSQRYWHIIVGPWLMYYLSMLYDRYISLKTAIERIPDFQTIGLSKDSFIIPLDTLEFIQYCYDDYYNLQFYTKILEFMGIGFARKSSHFQVKPVLNKKQNNLIRRLVSLLNNLMMIRKSHVVLKSSYFPHSTEFKFLMKTMGKILPIVIESLDLPAFPVNYSGRAKLQGILSGKTEFEKLINHMIPDDIPQSIIEGFRYIEEYTNNNYPPRPKVIFSANAWYFDEAFKQWSAQAAENGTKLIGTQHGGNYGSFLHNPSEDYELGIVDRYYTWGWHRNDVHAQKTSCITATKLHGRIKMKADNNLNGLLFLSTACPRYMINLIPQEAHFNDYLDWQFRFVNDIDISLREQMRIRLHYFDGGWDLAQRWREQFPDIQVEKWTISFLKSLKNCRLYICDHLSTTFIEALSVNKPSIIFWDPEVFKLRDEAIPFYDELRIAGVLYDNPEDAAEAVNSFYLDIEDWWNNPQRQSSVQKFCYQFGRTENNCEKKWIRELKSYF